MATNFWPSIKNNNSWRFWIWGKNALLNLITNWPYIDKLFLYAKVPYEAKYHLLIQKREATGLKYLNDSKAFTEYSNYMDDIDKKIAERKQNKNRKILVVFDDIIADMLSNKNLIQ